MKKEWWIIIILALVVVALAVFAFMQHNEKIKLNSIISGLEVEKQNLFNEKEQVIVENKDIKDKLDSLQKDVEQIYKSCPTENACKGKFPGISWYCNNVGDQTDITTASHNCICTPDCQLNATQIVK